MAYLAELLQNLPDSVECTVKFFKKKYNDEHFDKNVTKAEARGYVKGLRDMNVVTSDAQCRVLLTYITL